MLALWKDRVEERIYSQHVQVNSPLVIGIIAGFGSVASTFNLVYNLQSTALG